MAQEMKRLAKETAIYGLSSIVGRFLNWLLVPLYTFVLERSADYGIVTNVYAWVALLLVLLIYGMETGFFRFANKEGVDGDKVYANTLWCIGCTSLLFAVVCLLFRANIADALGYPTHRDIIAMMVVVVALDAYDSIVFAYLRYRRQSVKFAALKLFSILISIVFNLFFFLGCPWLMHHYPELVNWFYDADYGVGYVFVSNVISTALVTLALIPDMKFILRPDFGLLKKMLRYSLPLLILGVAGIMNQTLDKIIFPFLLEDRDFAASELGIYGACFKVAMVMMMFTQAFRYAYEPFVFSKHEDKNSVGAYADAMKYFLIFSLLIVLGMLFYLDVIKMIIHPSYWSGMRVVPIVLFSYVFQGVFFNLSLWYKLTDRTHYGAYFSLLGLAITLALNVLLVPHISYMGSAWASFACYLVMMLVSYFIGQRYMKIPYDLRSMGLYLAVTLVLLGLSHLLHTETAWLNYLINTALLGVYLCLMVKRDFPLQNLPVIGKFFKKP
ncbi:MAG: polysaccharide biosynthesis C-terminal domain-containing protein [Paludibacteraceae bacterium]|nr:polysaccharide biosynthesis C-terminal domain-containing protein [Paludibacteraceae bacterium]